MSPTQTIETLDRDFEWYGAHLTRTEDYRHMLVGELGGLAFRRRDHEALSTADAHIIIKLKPEELPNSAKIIDRFIKFQNAFDVSYDCIGQPSQELLQMYIDGYSRPEVAVA